MLARQILSSMAAKSRKLAAALVTLVCVTGGLGMVAARNGDPVVPNVPAQVGQSSDPHAKGKDRKANLDAYGDPLPAGAVMRLGTVRFRQKGCLLSLAFSADGKMVAAGGAESLNGWVKERGTLCLWDRATGKRLQEFVGHQNQVYCLAFTPDNKTLVSGSIDHTIRFWDVATGKELRQLEGSFFTMSPDGKLMALPPAAKGTEVELREVATGKVARKLGGHKRDDSPFTMFSVSPGPFSSDGKSLLTADAESFRVWDVATGRELSRHDRQREKEKKLAGGSWQAIVFAEKDLIGFGIEMWRTVVVRDVGRGKELARFEPRGGAMFSLAIAPDRKAVAVCSGYNRIASLWDIATGKELRSLGRFAGGAIMTSAFSPDGKWLAVGGEGGTVHVIDTTTGKEVLPDRGHVGWIGAVAVAPDGRTALTSSGRDSTLRVYDLATGKEVRQLTTEKHWRLSGAATFAPQGTTVGAARTDGQLYLWNAATGVGLHKFRIGGERLSGLAFSPDGKRVATSSLPDAKIHIWDVKAGKELLAFASQHQGMLNGLVFSPNGELLASAGGDESIRLWRTDTGRMHRILTGPRHEHEHLRGVEAIAFSPDGWMLAATASDHSIRLWEVSTGKERLRLKGHEGRVVSVAFSPKRGLLASGGEEDKAIRLWDVATGEELRHLEGHAGEVYALAFTPDGNRLISGSFDTTALVWDVSDLKPQDHPEEKKRSAKEWEELWSRLGDADAARAYTALCTVVASPKQALSVLAGHIHAESEPDWKKIAQFIADLDSDQFSMRKKASDELEKIGEAAVPSLRKALTGEPTPEARKRLEELLAKAADKPPDGDTLRSLRAVEVLEHISTPESRQLLQKLTAGTPDARLTREAKASLERMNRRHLEK
jgi:WD40 repeat protein